MKTSTLKSSTSIRINTNILAQIKRDAEAEHRSVSNYLETILYRFGYRPYNEETIQACKDVREGDVAGTVDTSSPEAFVASILGNEHD